MGRPPIYGTAMSATKRQQRWRAKQKKERDKIRRKAAALLAADKRRKRSRAAPMLADGWNLRIGDYREKLSDIEPNSVALILTALDRDHDLAWLASWSARVLIKGGSVICIVDPSRESAVGAALDRELQYWWQLCLPQDEPEVREDRDIISRTRFGLWYVKVHRRSRTMFPDVLPHNDIWPIIEHLTDPGETIVDPCGDRVWGRIVHRMGRRWIGVVTEPSDLSDVERETLSQATRRMLWAWSRAFS
jgi:hypothetical protein